MSCRVKHVLLLALCIHLSTSSKIEEVKPRWMYDNNITKPLPDSIEFDLELEGGKITLNLIRQSTEPIKPPLIITESEGQSSFWKHSERKLLGTYSDPFFDASATVTIKRVEGIEETLYMMTFAHDYKSFHLGPKAIFISDPFLNSSAASEIGEDDDVAKPLSIDGVLHSLFQTPSIELRQNRNLDEDYASDEVKDMKIVKRSARTPQKKSLFTIETFTVMDYSIYKKFFEESKAVTEEDKSEDAINTILYIFTHILEKVKNIFERIEMKKIKFTIKWKGVYIAKSADDTPFTENSKIDDSTIDGNIVFGKLEDWYFEKVYIHRDQEVPIVDFLAAFTSYSMKNGERKILGITSGGYTCSMSSAAVIDYNRFFVTIAATAHELGHILGADHDDDTDCKSHGTIMTAVVPAYTNDDDYKSYFFSKCSIESMETHLVGWRTSCLEDKGSEIEIPERSTYLNLLPGQIYNPDDQCRRVNGPESRYKGGDKDICPVLECTKGYDIRAFDGTPCSNGSWCRKGKCVKDGRAPKAPERCIYGDYKLDITLTNSAKGIFQCEQVNKNPLMCLLGTLEHQCCASCAGKRKKYLGCQDTLKECPSLEPRDCYYDYYATACCQTCSNLVQNSSNVNCLYGDRGTDCWGLVPAVCHLSTGYCCQTCSAYLSSTKKANPVSTTKRPIKTTTPDFFSSWNWTLFLFPSFPSFPSRTTLSSTSTTTTPPLRPTETASNTDACKQGDIKGTLEYQSLWGKPLSATCEELVKHDPNFCNNEDSQKYCCASCKNVETVKDYCKSDNDTTPLLYRSKYFNCAQLVKHNPVLCATDKIKKQCCKSCGRFTVRPSKVE